jgi:hypothetical protein
MKSDKVNLFKKISKIVRVPFSQQHRKPSMTWEEFVDLVDGEIVIEEKLDGATYFIELDEEPDISFFAEYLKIRHTVIYDKVPFSINPKFLWYVVFDVYDKKEKKFLDRKEKAEYAEVYEFPMPRVLFRGKLKGNRTKKEKSISKLARRKSKFGPGLMEGVVIKNYEKQLFGKYINEEFRIEKHYRDIPRELNKLDMMNFQSKQK